MAAEIEHPAYIFVGGCMRTGTTLVQRILCASPLTNDVIAECLYLRDQLELFANWRKQFDVLLKDYFGTPDNYDRYMRTVVLQLLSVMRARNEPARTIVLKAPEIVRFFPALRRWLADARFVVVVRDPRDTIASMREVGEKLAASRPQDFLVRSRGDVTALARFYKSYYVPVLNAGAAFRGRLVLVRYEDVVLRPRDTIEMLGRACAVPIDATAGTALPPKERVADVETPSPVIEAFWSPLYEQGIEETRIGRHEHVLDPREVRAIEDCCADFNAVVPYW